MTFTLRWATGSEQTLDVDSQICTRKGEIIGTLPYAGSMDCFDYISDSVNTWVLANLPTMTTRFGTLYLNSIQLSERFYAQHYEFSASYSTVNKQTGTYQITVDQAVGNENVAAGELIACYPAGAYPTDETGSFHDGREQKSFPVPVEEDRITVAYRHPKAYLNAAYIRAIGRLRGKPNSDTFLGYDPGEVRYMGGNFTQSDSEASASYTFEISPNVTNLVMYATPTDAGITIATKSGFDIVQPVWEAAEGTTDGGDKLPIVRPKYVKVIRPKRHVAYKSVFGWG